MIKFIGNDRITDPDPRDRAQGLRASRPRPSPFSRKILVRTAVEGVRPFRRGDRCSYVNFVKGAVRYPG